MRSGTTAATPSTTAATGGTTGTGRTANPRHRYAAQRPPTRIPAAGLGRFLAITTAPANSGAARLSPLPGILGLIGGAMMAVALFLNWYKLTAEAGPLEQSHTYTSWHVMEHPDVARVEIHSAGWLRYTEWIGLGLAALVLVVALILLIRSLSGSVGGGGGLLIVLAILAILYIAYRLLLGPANYLAVGDIHGKIRGIPVTGHYDRLYGEFIFLGGAIIALIGGLLGRRRPVVVAPAAATTPAPADPAT
jgi:hypothetical protein